MKFIRDIIKEKRRAEPQDAPVEPLETLRREPVAETAPPSAFAMTNFDDDTFDIARPARKDPEEDFDLFAEDDDDDFEPWQPRAEQAAPAPEPVAAVQEEEETAAEDYAFEENLEEEETSEAEDAFDVEAFDEDEPFAQEPSEDSDQFGQRFGSLAEWLDLVLFRGLSAQCNAKDCPGAFLQTEPDRIAGEQPGVLGKVTDET